MSQSRKFLSINERVSGMIGLFIDRAYLTNIGNSQFTDQPCTVSLECIMTVGIVMIAVNKGSGKNAVVKESRATPRTRRAAHTPYQFHE